MKKLSAVSLSFIISLFILPFHSSAQVSISMELNYPTYLQYECIYARLHLRNYSAHALAFGESKGLSGSLKFQIQKIDGGISQLLNKDELPPMKGLVMPPNDMQAIVFPVSDYYSIREKGRYSIKAIVSHSQLPSPYVSNEVFFSVVGGETVWERIVGVPDYINKDPDSLIQTRKYKLISFLDGRNKVYSLVIEDEKSIYAAKRIGFDMGKNAQPQCEIDSLSRVNIMMPVNKKVFVYYKYSLDGILEAREVYIKTSTTPTIVLDKTDGSLIVAGGRVARKDLDYEEIKDLPFMDKIEKIKSDDQDDATPEL